MTLRRIALLCFAVLACSDAGSVHGRISDPAGADTARYGAFLVQLVGNPDSARAEDSTHCAEYLAADSAIAARFAQADSTERSALLEEHGDLIDHFASDVRVVFRDLAIQTDTSDADGRFSFSNVPAGDYALYTLGRTGGAVGWWWQDLTVRRGDNADQDLTAVVPVRSWCERRYRSGRPSVWGASGPP